MTKKLIIFGLSNIAECAYEYFTHDSNYEVMAFTVDRMYISDDTTTIFGLPIVPFDSLEEEFSTKEYHVFVAMGAHKLNRLRTQKVFEVKEKGYQLASYISSRAFIWPNVKIGEHVFIQEDNTVQPFVEIGDNVTLWAGNHIGHASKIEDNCFITSHVVISGHCRIGENTFIGVNAAIADTVTVGCDNFIGMGVNLSRNTEDDSFYKPAKSELAKVGAKRFAKVDS